MAVLLFAEGPLFLHDSLFQLLLSGFPWLQAWFAILNKERKEIQTEIFSQLFEILWLKFFYEYFIDSSDFSIWSKKIVLFFYHLLLSLFVFYFLFDRNICNFNQLCRGKNQKCIGSLFSTEKYEWGVWTGPFFSRRKFVLK